MQCHCENIEILMLDTHWDSSDKQCKRQFVARVLLGAYAGIKYPGSDL